jgi:hypothetical protein
MFGSGFLSINIVDYDAESEILFNFTSVLILIPDFQLIRILFFEIL